MSARPFTIERLPHRRFLPHYLGGALVSELAYRIAALALGDGITCPRRMPVVSAHLRVDVSGDPDLFRYVADLLEVDEADVLRAMAELQRVGAITPRAEA